jgi:hypothetical protein
VVSFSIVVLPRFGAAKGTRNAAAAQYTVGSIGGEEAAVGSAGPNADANRPGAFRAAPLVGGLASVDVNPYVDVATGESHADESASTILLPRRIRSLAARDVQVTSLHCLFHAHLADALV